MKNFRVFLALFAVSYGLMASAQYDDGGAVGGICERGQHCPPPFPGAPGEGRGHGGGGIDPSPYDPYPGRPQQPGRPQPGRPQPGRPPSGGLEERREVYVGQFFQNQLIDLVRTVGLFGDRGRAIRSVEVTVRANDAYTTLALLADGRVEDQQYANRGYVTLQPRSYLVIGQSARNILMEVRGRLYIDRISVILDGGYGQPNPQPPYPGPGEGDYVATGYVNQVFYAPGNVDVFSIANLYQYRGYRVVSVTVYGRALQSVAGARLLGNGMIIGQMNLDTYGLAQTIYSNQYLVVGSGLENMNLLVDGQARIDRIDVRLSRR